MNGGWHFLNEKIYTAVNLLSEEEQEIFNCDCKTINWQEFCENFVNGLAIWTLNED